MRWWPRGSQCFAHPCSVRLGMRAVPSTPTRTPAVHGTTVQTAWQNTTTDYVDVSGRRTQSTPPTKPATTSLKAAQDGVGTSGSSRRREGVWRRLAKKTTGWRQRRIQRCREMLATPGRGRPQRRAARSGTRHGRPGAADREAVRPAFGRRSDHPREAELAKIGMRVVGHFEMGGGGFNFRVGEGGGSSDVQE